MPFPYLLHYLPTAISIITRSREWFFLAIVLTDDERINWLPYGSVNGVLMYAAGLAHSLSECGNKGDERCN